MSSSSRLTKRLSRRSRATRPGSVRSSSSAHSAEGLTRRDSFADTETLEAITGDGIAAQQHRTFVSVQSGLPAQPMGDRAGVRPGAVGVRVVRLEKDLLHTDLLAAPKAVQVIEDAPVDAAAHIRRRRLGKVC